MSDNKVKFEFLESPKGHVIRFWIDQQGFTLSEIKDFKDEPSAEKRHWYTQMIACAFYRMADDEYKRHIIRALKEDDLFSFSKIAEILGIRVTQVREAFIEREVYSDGKCVFNYCPDENHCKKHGCKNAQK